MKKTAEFNMRAACSLPLTAFLIIACVFASCGRDPLPPPEKEEKIIFWTTMGAPSDAYLKKIVNSYNAANPAMKVEFVKVHDSLTDIDSLSAAISNGDAPDIYMMDRFTVAQRAAGRGLQDLTAYLDNSIEYQYLKDAWAETQFRGKTYALPFDADVRGLFYNKKMLKAAGLTDSEIEELNYLNGPITLARLEEFAQKVDTKISGSYTKTGFIPQMDQGWHYTWGFCFGGEFTSPDFKTVTPGNSGVTDGFQFLYDWNNAMGADEVQSFLNKYNYINDPEDYANHPFIKEDLAMTINGDWFMDIIEKYGNDIDYDVTFIPVPKAGDKPTTWMGGWAWGIPSGSKKTEEALKFIVYGCGVTGQRSYCADYNKAPTVLGLPIEEFYAVKHPYFQEAIQHDFANIRPPLPVGASYWDALTEAQDKVVKNEWTAAEALLWVKNEIQPKLDNILQQY